MKSYVDFNYYQNNQYPTVNQDDFNILSRRASLELARLIHRKVLPETIENSEYKEQIKECVCDLIVYLKNDIQNFEKGIIKSESVGPHSVTINTEALIKDEKIKNIEIRKIVEKHLFDTGLLYAGI